MYDLTKLDDLRDIAARYAMKGYTSTELRCHLSGEGVPTNLITIALESYWFITTCSSVSTTSSPTLASG